MEQDDKFKLCTKPKTQAGFRKIPMIKKVYDVLVYQQTYSKDIATRISLRKGFESGSVF